MVVAWLLIEDGGVEMIPVKRRSGARMTLELEVCPSPP